MLLLVGIGLGTKDMSVGALEEVKKADAVFLETYTSFAPRNYAMFIKRAIGKSVKVIERHDLEDDVNQIVALAKRKRVAILVPGDPLVATTHSIILNEAHRQRVKFMVFHSASIFSVAIGESGLDVYKFGPTVTIPFWFERYKPTSFLDVLQRNVNNRQHTLLLLDMDQKNKRPMRISEAVSILEQAEERKKTGIINYATKLILLANAGSEDQRVKYLRIWDIDGKTEKELEGKLISLILPAQLTFAEKESLERIVGIR